MGEGKCTKEMRLKLGLERWIKLRKGKNEKDSRHRRKSEEQESEHKTELWRTERFT